MIKKIKTLDKMNIILILMYLLTEILVNFVFEVNIVGLLIVYFITYITFIIYSFYKLKSLKKMILSAEVIFETVFFMYSVPAAIMFVLDGYKPRIPYFLIDTDTMLRTLLLYFNINCIFIMLMLLTGGVKTAEYDEEKNKKLNMKINIDIWDIIALVLTSYFCYLYLRNGLEIFTTYFHTLREMIQSSIHNFNSYVYLYMIIYEFVNFYKLFYVDNSKYNDANDKKRIIAKKCLFIIISVVFWGFSILTDRRNMVNLIFLIALLCVTKLKKIGFKKIIAAISIVMIFLLMSFFRAGTNLANFDINKFIFLTNGEFILSSYVSDYYINNCDNLKYGKTYIYDTLVSVIPRKIFPDKPKMLSEQFQEDAKTNVAYAFNPVAEGLINFGVVGATFAVPVVLLLYVKLAYFMNKKNLLYYIIICGYTLNIFRGTFSTVAFALLVMMLLTYLMLYRRKNKGEKMKQDDLISIIMSTYNTNIEYLKKSVESILNQTYKNIEFIIINDGGKDIDYLKQINDERIIIINHKEKTGLAVGLNEAIEVAKGKYIARMDSDDISILNRIEKQYEFMENNPDIAICSSFAKQFDESNKYLFNVWKDSNDLHSQLFFTNILIHPAVMIRKSFLIENNLKYSEDFLYSQDFEFWTRLSKFGKIAILPQIVLLYRVHKNQVSLDKKEKQKELYESILVRNLKNLDLNENELKYIEMLNGYNNQIDFEGLSNFIQLAIEKNKKMHIYDEKSFEKVLYNAFNNLYLKNKNGRKIKQYFIYGLKVYNLEYLIRKLYYELKVRVMYKKVKKGL